MDRAEFRIAVDAMGGDFAPAAPVEGAVWAARDFGQPVILVGRQEVVEAELKKLPGVPSSLIEIYDAPEVVGMDEPAAVACKRKKGASIRVAFDLVKQGKAHGVVSAGNSGAIMAAATLVLGRTKGVDRPAIAGILPTLKGPTVLIDVGANVNCKPRNLFQFGIMGDIYARSILHLENPAVGLLSVGEESIKGNDLVRRVHELLRNTDINFIGNVEGRDIFAGKTQVIICDGFVGNVCLKLAEGVGQAFARMIKQEVRKSFLSTLGYFFARGAFGKIRSKMDYAEYGGAPLIGMNGPGVVCHGASSSKAVKNAVRVAAELARNRVNEHLARGLELFAERNPEGVG
jgi:glycerol-3-phosphate acyltransferase PlsX